jgi:predicted lipoprotein with Yx(FWY)xxD motif
MSQRVLLPLAFAAVALIGGCETLGLACPDVGGFAIQVELRNAATGELVAGGATLVIRDGEYADSVSVLDAQPPVVLSAGAEREGVYDVVVRKPGYQEWTQQDVRVGRGGACGRLSSAELTAELVPMGPATQRSRLPR